MLKPIYHINLPEISKCNSIKYLPLHTFLYLFSFEFQIHPRIWFKIAICRNNREG